MSERVRTLVADPPWPFRDRLPGKGRGAEKHYRVLPLHEIQRFPLPELAEDCRLFLWRVASMQDEALAVMRAWGFTPKAELVWVKPAAKRHAQRIETADRGWWEEPPLRLGMGRQVRNTHEVCLIGVRGRPEQVSKSQPSVIFAPRSSQHSEKPEEFYQAVERLSPGPYVELFGRRRRAGWFVFGDELDGAEAHP